MEEVGGGRYGQMWLACDKMTNELVALKRNRMDNEGGCFPLTAILRDEATEDAETRERGEREGD